MNVDPNMLACALVALRLAQTGNETLRLFQAASCQNGADPSAQALCDRGWSDFGVVSGWWERLKITLFVIPFLLGAFLGVPIFSRDFEQRTSVFALTQSVSRLRWWTTKIVVALVPVGVVMLGIGYLTEWATLPMLTGTRLYSPDFEVRGPVPAVLTVLFVAVGATAGLVLRSTIGGIIAALVLTAVAGIALSEVRAHLVPASRSVVPVDPRAVFGVPDSLDSFYLRSGYLDAAGAEVDFDYQRCTLPDGTDIAAYDAAQSACFAEQKVVAYFSDYLPGSRRGQLQLLVSGIALLLSAAFLALGARRLGRRAV